MEVPDNASLDNGFKVRWEQFLRRVVDGVPWHYSLIQGAKDVRLAEAGYRGARERRWFDLEDRGL